MRSRHVFSRMYTYIHLVRAHSFTHSLPHSLTHPLTHTHARARADKHTHTHTHRKRKNWRMRAKHNVAKTFRNALLRIRTISGHVIAVSARQLVRRNMYSNSKWIHGMSGVFFVMFICSLLIAFMFNGSNLVVVNGHDDIEMWTTSSISHGDLHD